MSWQHQGCPGTLCAYKNGTWISEVCIVHVNIDYRSTQVACGKKKQNNDQTRNPWYEYLELAMILVHNSIARWKFIRNPHMKYACDAVHFCKEPDICNGRFRGVSRFLWKLPLETRILLINDCCAGDKISTVCAYLYFSSGKSFIFLEWKCYEDIQK